MFSIYLEDYGFTTGELLIALEYPLVKDLETELQDEQPTPAPYTGKRDYLRLQKENDALRIFCLHEHMTELVCMSRMHDRFCRWPSAIGRPERLGHAPLPFNRDPQGRVRTMTRDPDRPKKTLAHGLRCSRIRGRINLGACYYYRYL